MTIRILIADDHAVFRSGLRALLEKEPDLEVVAEAANGHETLRYLDSEDVDVLLLDLSMPGGMSGPKTAEAALRKKPRLAIVVLTMHEDEYYLRQMFNVGIRAYVLKKSNTEDVLRAIRAACKGEHFVDPALTAHMLDSYVGRPTQSESSQLGLLTRREQEVCRLLAMGYTNAEVGEKLAISQRTVETHRANIMAKLDLRSRAELVRFAIDNRLLRA